jgi:hypothetical protein
MILGFLQHDVNTPEMPWLMTSSNKNWVYIHYFQTQLASL